MAESENMATSSPSKPRSETRNGRIPVIVGVFGLFVLVFLLAMRSRQMLATPPELVVDEQCLWFGEVWEDDHFAWKLPIQNRSTFDVTIERFYNSCLCTEVNPRSIVIPAGRSREIKLIIDLMTKYRYDKSTGLPRDFAVTIGAIGAKSDGNRVNHLWELRGQVKRAIEFDQPEIDFGMHSEREQPVPSRRVATRSFTPLNSLAATISGLDDFHVSVIQRQADPSMFDLEISPSRFLLEAKYNFTLNVVPILSDGKRLPAKKLPVSAWIVPDVQAFPPEIQFGAVPIGGTAEATMTLASLTGKTFKVMDWNCTSDFVNVERQGTNPNEPGFHIQWKRVTSLGQHEAEVVIRIKMDSKEEKTIKVPVKCLGIRGIVKLDKEREDKGVISSTLSGMA